MKRCFICRNKQKCICKNVKYSGKKLNLGCGENYIEGWVNVDMNPKVKADSYFDITKPFPITEKFDFVLLRMVLEHTLNPTEIIAECHKVLNKGGKLHIVVPHISHISSIFGDIHKTVYTTLYFNTIASENYPDWDIQIGKRFASCTIDLKFPMGKIDILSKFMRKWVNKNARNQRIYEEGLCRFYPAVEIHATLIK